MPLGMEPVRQHLKGKTSLFKGVKTTRLGFFSLHAINITQLSSPPNPMKGRFTETTHRDDRALLAFLGGIDRPGVGHDAPRVFWEVHRMR